MVRNIIIILLISILLFFSCDLTQPPPRDQRQIEETEKTEEKTEKETVTVKIYL